MDYKLGGNIEMINYSKLSLRKKKIFWKENPLIGEIEIKIEGIDTFKMYNENDDTVVKELYWTGFKGWELTSLTLWSDLLKINDGNVVYDVGAYTGIYSLIASKFSSELKIYAFDIQGNTLNRLKKNCEINNFKNIELSKTACTSFNGETTFYFYKEEGIISSVAGLIKKEMNNLKENVKAIRLDDFKFEADDEASIGLIKIDVEDAEIETLKGMQELLLKQMPDVLIEVNNIENLKKVKKLFPKNYSVFDIDEGNYKIKKLTWLNKPSKYRNYFFTTKKMELIKKLFSGTVK